MGSRLGVLIAGAALFAGLAAMPAQAAFPGANGKIAFASPEDGDYEIFVMNQDGTGAVQLTHNTSFDQGPAWSPDGTRIAFTSDRDETDPECSFSGGVCNREIYVMNADGTGQTRLTTNPASDEGPEWTPDGSKVTFTRLTGCAPDGCETLLRNVQLDGSGESFQAGAGPGSPSGVVWAPNGQRIINSSYEWSSPGGALYTANPDGTGDAFFCCTPLPDGDNPPPSGPDWSPDGSAVAFRHPAGGGGVARQSVAGGGFVILTPGREPAWSPDGSKIAFVSSRPEGNGIYVMNSDGTNPIFVRSGSSPDWQPIPINGYPRPIATEPLNVSLVLAYERCTSPKRIHGPPIEEPSCAPPVGSSSQLTVGTPDSNGQGSKSTARVTVSRLPGDPDTTEDEADVRLRATVTDVRLASDLSDYTGSLEARMALRITDKDNTPHPGGPGAATVSDITYSFPVPCTVTDKDDTIGSQCAVDTTADALVPGTIKERRRTIWQLGQVALHDGAGNAFMRQGIFVP